jgi:hypothetical protein
MDLFIALNAVCKVVFTRKQNDGQSKASAAVKLNLLGYYTV